MEYRKRLTQNAPSEHLGNKTNQTKIIVTHSPSEIDQNQELLVRFPNLGSDDVIIPGTFSIELSSTADLNRTFVSNIGRAVIKKLEVKFEGNEIMSIDDYDIFTCYRDLWKTASEKKNVIRQGIISADGFTLGCMRLRINAKDKSTAPPPQDKLHGMGRRIENASEGITLQIEKKAETAGALNAYIYLIMDAQLNIQSGAYVSAVY